MIRFLLAALTTLALTAGGCATIHPAPGPKPTQARMGKAEYTAYVARMEAKKAAAEGARAADAR
ncbi:MAG: hypothetical protein KC635_02950 [Myxococcales bacterium]|nr:hypothetical protein [Myxococcales bacterium]MCB9735779.1 hypothetical protein [Deltaproteobacteria bacterium]